MIGTLLTMTEQMAVLFMFIAFGYLFVKIKIFKDGASDVLSKISVNIFCPALSFSTMVKCCTVKSLTDDKWIFLAGTITLICGFAIAFFASRAITDNRDTKNIYTYALTCSNFGYVGYPIVTALMGEKALFDFMIFALPFSIYSYTLAIQILKPDGKASIKGLIKSPPAMAMFAGMAVGLSGISTYLPAFITDFASKAGSCMTPVGMIAIGAILGRLELSKLFNDAKAYIVSAIRLVILPLMALAVYYLFHIRGKLAILGVIFLCLPTGMNTVVFPEAYGGDGKSGAKIVFLTNTAGIITIPIIISVANHLLA